MNIDLGVAIVVGAFGLFGAALTLAGTVYVALRGARVNQEQTAVNAAEKLWGRVDGLDLKVAGLTNDMSRLQHLFDVAVGYIDTLLNQWGSGTRPPRPPSELHHVVDRSRWDTRP